MLVQSVLVKGEQEESPIQSRSSEVWEASDRLAWNGATLQLLIRCKSGHLKETAVDEELL